VILSDEDRRRETESNSDIALQCPDANGVINTANLKAELAYTPTMRGDVENRLQRYVGTFELVLQPKIVALTLNQLAPNFAHDEAATTAAQNRAAALVATTQGQVSFKRNQVIVP